MKPNTLIERLRGLVRIPVNDGAGLLDGKDFFERSFPTSNLAKEAAAEIERLTGAVPTWRPINTAPTYETILVAGGDALYPVTASWDGDNQDGWWVDGQEDVHCEIGWPTHWMPLPEAPVSRTEDADS